MQEHLNARKVVECLNRLGELLVEMEVQVVVRILMIGGAYMVTQIQNRIGDLMVAAAVGQVPEGKLWLRSGLLEVYIPEPRYVLALKMLAHGRAKDAGDVQVLYQQFGISNRRQVWKLLKKYFSKSALEVYAEDIQASFAAFGPPI